MDTIEKAIQKLSELSPAAGSKVEHDSVPPPLFEPAPAARPVAPKAPAVDSHEYHDDGIRASLRPSKNSGKRTKRSATLDLQKIRQAGMVVPDTKRSRIKEEFRHIKRPLLMNAAGKGASVVEYGNLIMVTSASPGEGKTFTAINLALSVASERDQTVLLVDADVVKPSVSKFFGVDTGLGLVDFLIDDSLDLSEVLVETNVPSLTVLPAGSTHHLSTELLSSENMRDLAHEMSRRYPDRIVVFDSPPLLATTEARVLAGLVGQVVMVVEAERTQQSQVHDALALLDPDTIIGFILNKTRHVLGSGYYKASYYGYGYGYGYGYQYGDSGRD